MNNKKNEKLLRAEANQRQRFSIRKLTIGAASVLLSTAFYLGTSATVSHAETKPLVTPTSEQEAKSGSLKQSDSDQVSSDQAEETSSNDENQYSSSTKENAQKFELANTKNYKNTNLKTSLVKQSPTNEQKSTKLSIIGSDTVKTGDKISFNLTTNDYTAGDVIKVIFDENSNGLDTTGTYDIDKAKNEALADTVSGESNNTVFVTNTFTHAGTFSQDIDITTNNNFDRNKLQSDGTFTRTVHVLKNDQEIQTLTFKQIVKHNTYLTWVGSDSENSIQTTDNPQQNVKNGVIVPNTDYQWGLRFNITPTFNHGLTLNIPVPEDFVLNENATKSANQDIFSTNLYNGQIKRDGNTVKLTLPELNNDILKNLQYKPNESNDKTLSFNLVGSFKTKQTDSIQKIEGSDLTVNEKFSQTDPTQVSDYNASPIKVTIPAVSKTGDQIPIGEILDLNIDSDQSQENDPKQFTTMDNTSVHSLNNYVSVTNKTPYALKNVTAEVDIPDGMDITSFKSYDSKTANFKYHYVYTDNTESSEYSFINHVDSKHIDGQQADNGKYIKKIVFSGESINAYQPFFNINLMGTLAKNYQNGTPVKENDHLKTSLTASYKNQTTEPAKICDQVVLAKTPPKPEVKENKISSYVNQYSKEPGTVKSGYIEIDADNFADDQVNTTFYVVLPNNTTLNGTDPISNLPMGANYSLYKNNNRDIVKITYNNIPRKKAIQTFYLNLDNSNIITKDNKNSETKIFVELPSGEKIDDGNNHKLPESDKAFFDNPDKVLKVDTNNWVILAATGTYPVTQSKGNKNLQFTIAGSSDDHGSADMSFNNYVVNDDDKDLMNVTSVVQIPNTADGTSEFNFTLTNPIKVYNDKTNQEITDAQIYYTTNDVDLENLNDSNFNQTFSSTSKPTDLSKVKAIAIKVGSIPTHSIYRIELNGQDKNLVKDVNKTAYVSSNTWSDILQPVVIKPKSHDSASITIMGQSTVGIKLHYVDDNGDDQYFDAGSLTLADGTTKLELENILHRAFNLNKIQNNDNDKADSDFRKKFEELFPNLKNYAVDVENPIVKNSDHGPYANNAPNGLAQIGEISQYDFDGDQIIFNLSKYQEINRSFKLNRHVDYISAIDNKKLAPSEIEAAKVPIGEIATATVKAIYDPITKKYSFPDLNNELKEFGISRIDDLPKFTGLTPLSSTKFLPAVSYQEIQNILNYNPDIVKALFEPASNKGKQVKLTEKFSGNDIQEGMDIVKVNDQATGISNGEIQFDVYQKVIYGPSFANLIKIGIIGQENQINIAKSIDGDSATDKIDFGHQSLDIPGYSYKIYYIPDVLNVSYQNADDRPKYIYLTAKDVKDATEEVYSNLDEALKAHPEFDDNSDNISEDDLNDGSPINSLNNTQNFIVIYTPTSEQKQNVYVMSDNDPYAQNEDLKPYALPGVLDSQGKLNEQATEQAIDQTIQKQIKEILEKAKENPDDPTWQSYVKQINDGTYLTLHKITGKAGNYLFDAQSSPNKFDSNSYLSSISSAYDDQGNQILVLPTFDSSKAGLGNLGMAPQYNRGGYYIQHVTLTSTDDSGKKHSIVITNHINLDNIDSYDLGSYSIGDDNLLKILDYLTNNQSESASSQLTTSGQGANDPDKPSFQISIDGNPEITITPGKDGEMDLANIPNADRFVFDNTQYKGQNDPKPQTIVFHYAPLPLPEDSNTIEIHYQDVTDIDPLDDTKKQQIKTDNGIDLPKNYRYSPDQGGNELHFDEQGNYIDDSQASSEQPAQIIFKFTKAGESYENSLDPAIITSLAKAGYYVVQRDKETSGKHNYNPYASDLNTHEFNYNGTQGMQYISGGSQQNYYVFVKKISSAAKVNYHVVLEDKDGKQIGQDLVANTELGYGDPGTEIAPTASDHTQEFNNSETIAKKYAAIKEALAKKYQNYELVLSNNKNNKLKKSDELTDQKFGEKDAEPLTLTLYMVPKYGNVTIHYIDVDSVKKEPKDLTSKDGKEITNYLQTPVVDTQYGESYQNTVRDYAKDGYDLVTTSLPDGTESGTVDSPNKDIYVFLKHKHSDLKVKPKTVNETIKFVDENKDEVKGSVSRKITFTPEGYHDDKTDKDIITGWTPSGNFIKNGKEVQFDTESTKVNGYDLDETTTKEDKNNPADTLNNDKNVAAITIDPTQKLKDITLTIHYKKNSSIKINYVDVEGLKKEDFDNKGKTIANGKHNISKAGHVGDSVFENSTPWDYLKDDWVFVHSTSPVDSNLKIGKEPQEITVYLKHKHSDLKVKPKIVNETIKFVGENNKEIQGSISRQITFTPVGYHDDKTGDDIITGWTPSGDFIKNCKEVQFGTESTKVNGYDLDEEATKKDLSNPSTVLNKAKNISAITIDPTKELKDISLTIHYKKNSSIKINYVDVEGLKKEDFDDKGKTIENGEHNIYENGHAGDSVFKNLTPWDYLKDNWVFVDSTSPVDSNLRIGNQPQEITVYLKHKHSDLKVKPKTVNETIKFVDENKDEVQGSISRHITFTPEGYHDDRTGDDIITGWTPSGDFIKNGKEVQFGTQSTKVNGFDLDKTATMQDVNNPKTVFNSKQNVAAISVDEKSSDVNLTIHYKHQVQTHIHYIDVNDSDKKKDFKPTDGTAIPNHDIEYQGHINDPIFSNSQSPWNFLKDGWILAENPANVNKDMKLTKDTPQDVYVYLKHATEKLHKTIHVTEIIHYVDENGTPINDEHGKAIITYGKNKLTLLAQGHVDKISHQEIITGWKAKNGHTFAEVDLKKFDGYEVLKATHQNQDNQEVNDLDSKKQHLSAISFDPAKVSLQTKTDQNLNVYVVLKKTAPNIEQPSDKTDNHNPKTEDNSSNSSTKPNKHSQNLENPGKTKIEHPHTETITNHNSISETATTSAKVEKTNINKPIKTARTKSRNVNKQTLPQTGTKQNTNGLIALAFAGLASLFGLAANRKRKD